jgi:hypothetical protein
MRAVLRAVTWLALAAGGAGLAYAPAQAAPASSAPSSPARIVVAFANPASGSPPPAGTTGARYGGDGYRLGQGAQQQAHRLASSYSLREVASWPIQALSMHCVVYEITDARPLADVLANVSRDPSVLLAEPLHEFHTLGSAADGGVTYNDPLYDMQTNLTALGIARAHRVSQGADVHIALIDTGVDTTHPDLRGRIVRTHSYLDKAAGSAGALRHGTAMAGLIAAVANNHIGMVGIAPLARVEVFEACWQLTADADAAACNTFTLAQALAGALGSGATLINLSLAGPADPLLTALVQASLKRGMVVVGAAAGADAPFPTAIPGVITASGSEPSLANGALAAPAQHVLTLRPGGEYDFESGSSVAAAEITGVIALLMAASPGHLSGDTLASLLKASAPAVNANEALARLAALRGQRGLAARTAH